MNWFEPRHKTKNLCLQTAQVTLQLAIPPGSLNRVPASAGGKGGIHTTAGWQVMACEFSVAVKANMMLTAITVYLLTSYKTDTGYSIISGAWA